MECLKKIERKFKGKEKIGRFIFFTLLFTSCSVNYCDDLIKSIEEQLDKHITQVSFNETFSFEWDTLYIFDSMIYPKEISDIIGFDCDCDLVLDGSKLLIFTNNNNIVRKQASVCSNLTFIDMKNRGVVKLNRSSTFNIKKKGIDNRIFYTLTPMISNK